MLGVRVVEVRADNPTADMAGRIRYVADTDLRDEALVVVAGEIGQPDWPPEWPARFAPAGDERRLAEIVGTPEEARQVLLDLAFVPEDAIGPLIIMESRHLDREGAGPLRAVGGA
jgi:hypothetical protein